jgi:transposase
MVMIAFDSHKHYTVASVQTKEGKILDEARIEHAPGNIYRYLEQWEKGSPVAVETIGNWYWIIEEIEAAQMQPRLVNARKAKLLMGSYNKTDRLDAHGLNKLQRVGVLPTVWIAPAGIRDTRELPRTRMFLAVIRTRLKNRIHSVIDKYGMQHEFQEMSDIFGKRGRERIRTCIPLFPEQTGSTLGWLLDELTEVEGKIEIIEQRIQLVTKESPELKLIMTLPGIGLIIGIVIIQEVGNIQRFADPERYSAYSGTVPRVHASGGKVHYGRLRPDTNHYLKWAYAEAGNLVALNQRNAPQRHVTQLYQRIRQRRGHATAVGAVARHLAEATYWVLTKKENYLDPNLARLSRDV